jgi:hypothetical protein
MPFDQAKVAYPNKKKDPPADGSAYVEVAHFPNRSDRYGLKKGEGKEHMLGFLQLLVRAPRNEGGEKATKIAGELALHFPADLSLWSEGVRVRISKRPDVMSASPTEASWNVPVTVYYEAFA